VVDVSVYSNAHQTALTLNGADLGAKATCDNHVCTWREVKLSVGENHLAARGQFGDKSVVDTVNWTLSADAASHVRIDSGAMMGRVFSRGRFGSDNYFVGGEPSNLIRSKGFAMGPADPKGAAKLMPGAVDPDLAASFREGDFSYDLPLENGVWQVRLDFVAPAQDVTGARVFDITANGAVVRKDYDIAAVAGGPLKPVQESFPVTVTDGRLKLDFHPSKGKALVSGLDISR
jgi:beta-galactosidase